MSGVDRLVAVSGLGSIGYQHLQALSGIDGVRLAVYDPSSTLADRARRLLAVRHAADSFQDLLELRPQAMVIAGPDHAHLPQLVAAINAGIATLVEKPLAPTADDARAVAGAVVAAPTPVLVGYVLRHRELLRRMRELIVSGAVGKPTAAQVVVGAYETITLAANRFATPESNRLYRDYSHEWDYLRWFFGAITEVVATSRTDRSVSHVESPNLVDALLRHESGVVAACHIDYVATPGLRTIHVIGTAGSLLANLGDGMLELRSSGNDHRQLFQFAERPRDALRRQAEHLLAVADGSVDPKVTFADGLAAIDVVDALIASAGDGRWRALRPAL